jgi:hypothetical protein
LTHPARFSCYEYGDRRWEEKRGVEFYSDKLRHHWFSSEYFSVGVNVEFFEPE